LSRSCAESPIPSQRLVHRVETWNREAREEGVFVTVPQEAQQAIVFLAPETGGDFSTLPMPFVGGQDLCPRQPGPADGELGPDAP